ncbi:cytochrome c oxidase subunit II [Vallicoccus soli]|uniref:cytochrome-c oxidase n=1 Tax=Vallicoccus soli TaxID=2339232 RepID=A0A3A3YYQ4_9ACTN|nr:cytochrome c oxidase subunit II [Vallicoccus soli]RJK96901.1 cytochrome c oxidase subunit II [Vallicoccus soli]
MSPTGTSRSARDTSPPRPRRHLRALALLLPLALLATGCSAESREEWRRGGLPEGASNYTDRVTTLWQGSWVVALMVGALVWGLIFWSVVRFRRRATDTGLPPQVRYNVPVEALYTTLPIIVVLVFFYFTARDQSEILEVSDSPDRVVQVVGKRWSWDFNYFQGGSGVADSEAVAFETGTPGEPPTLYLPQGESVRFVLDSRDVAHSFFVPNFLFKMDLYPGRTNEFELTPTRTGLFQGRCAEFCGLDHSRMLFNVQVVTPEEYDQHLEDLIDRGQAGQLPAELGPKPGLDDSRQSTLEGDQ